MKELKRRLEMFSFYDHSGIERHLEEMAEDGWLLMEIKPFAWVYRRIKPQKLHFAVTYYPKASNYDPEPQEGQLIYRDYSAKSGWEFICQSAQMQVFCSKEEDPVPMETDPAVEVQTIHRAAKKGFLLTHFILLAIAVMQGILFVSRLVDDPVGLLSETTNLATGACWVMLFLLCTVELVGYFNWHRKAVRAAETGEFLETHGHSLFQKIVLISAMIMLIYSIINMISAGNRLMLTIYVLMITLLLLVLVIVNAVTRFMKRKKVSRNVNFAVTMIVDFILVFALITGVVFYGLSIADGSTEVVYREELPLSLEDLNEAAPDGYIRQNRPSESIFLGQMTVYQGPQHGVQGDAPELHYTLTVVKVSALYGWCKESLLKRREDRAADGFIFINHYEKIDAAPWLAEEAYQLHWSESVLDTYLLCYEDCIVEIEFNWTPSEDQMRVVGEKLNPVK